MSVWEPPTGPIPVQPQPVQRGGGVAWAVAAFAVAVLLGVLALWATVATGDRAAAADGLNQTAARVENEAKQAVKGADAGNDALTDPTRTAQVTKALSDAIEATFSYDHADLAATERAVAEHLTGAARCVYDQLFGEVKRYASEQKIVLTTAVREIALVRLDGDRAEALVYIDQSSTRVDVNKTVAVGGQLGVVAQRHGESWQITEFDMFDQPLFSGEAAPKC